MSISTTESFRWPEGFAVVLDAVITRTGHNRYRELCDPVHADFDPRYIPIVEQIHARFTGAVASAPSLGARVASLGKAIVTHVAAGLPKVSDEELDRRLGICRSNVCEMFNPEGMRCQACGCRLEIKARWSEQRCPRSFW